MTPQANTPRPLSASILAITVLSVALTAGCARTQQQDFSAAEHNHPAQLSNNGEDFGPALDLLGIAASRNPNDVSVQTRYATALAQAGHNQQALRVITPVYDRNKTADQSRAAGCASAYKTGPNAGGRGDLR